MIKTLEIDVLLQPLIEAPPPQLGSLYDRSCSADQVTVESWRKIWIDHTRANKEQFKSFADHSIGKLHNINHQKPVIVCGSGPSLKTSIPALKANATSPAKVMVVSCLHNFGYFEDEGFHADYYMTLDSGKIVMSDVYEGRKQKPEHYWEATKGKKLLATIMSDPELLAKWQGEIYLFSCLIPDDEIRKVFKEIEHFSHYVSSGGNALGGSMYVAKAIFGSDVIHYVGADFCFDYNNTFHSYKTHYDAIGQYVLWPDIYGIPRKTWQSYLNFKFWFDHIALNVPGRWVNCSEGLLGAYQGGNLRQFQYLDLHSALLPYRLNHQISVEKYDRGSGEVLGRSEIALKDLFSDPQYPEDIIIF